MTKHAPVFFILFFLPCFCFANAIPSSIPIGQHSFEYHGYYRSSLGLSENETNQTKFQAPGARGKYRLGNEPETNLELQLNYTYKMRDPKNDKAHVQGIFMLDGFKSQGESSDFTVGGLAQGYVSFNNFFDDSVKIWMGRRYYQRKILHIMNNSWLNPGQNSHAAVGFEDLRAGVGKLDAAVFRHEDNFKLDPSGDSYLINSLLLDVRYHDIKFSEATKTTLWGQFSLRKSLASLGYAHQTGYSLGYWVDYKSAKIKNTTALLYQTGASITQSGYNPRPVREDLGWGLDKARTLEINNSLTYENLPYYSFQWALLYRKENRGIPGEDRFSWYSSGVRPIFYLTRHLNIALEAGADYIDDEINQRQGHLLKFTSALQLAADRGFKSRPVLRLFVTVAKWGDELKGFVGHVPGDAPYSDETLGWSVGAQAEVWW